MSAKKPIFVHVEVLQNGEPLDSYRQKLTHNGLISLGRSWPNKLRMPYYPLLGRTKILRIRKQSAHLRLDNTWEGFISTKGELTQIHRTRTQDARLELKDGDYASIAKGDLRILIKVGPEEKEAPIEVKETFRGTLWSLFVGTKAETYGLLGGTLCSMALFGALIAGLSKRPDDRPKELADLPSSYVLGIVNPKHLGLLPETLQDKLVRSRTLDLAIEYYGELAVLISSGREEDYRLLLPSTVERMQRLHTLFQNRIEKYLDRLSTEERKILAVKGQAVLKIPAAIGESFDATLIRLEKNIDVAHRSQERLLNLRKIAAAEFKEDSLYDFNEFKKVKSGQSAKSDDPYKKLVSNLTTDEASMYADSAQWQRRAEMTQRPIKDQRQSFSPMTAELARPIAFKEDQGFAQFLTSEDLTRLNEKMSLIQPAQFGIFRAKQKPAVKEPLLGELDPKLVEKIISKNRFELQLCFELALRRNHNMAGTMKWQWRLDSRGKISDLTLVSSNIADRQMKNCVMKKISSWRFPRPKRGSVEITYPFHFKPAKG